MGFDDKGIGPRRMGNSKRWIFLAKLLVSAGIIGWIAHKIHIREGSEELWQRLASLSWPWLVAAAAMQLCAIAASVLRWDRLLSGQGIHAPRTHLLGSFMVGRFFGAFAPGGWTGLNGYRLYDIAVHTGKIARSTATIGIEMVTGNLGMGAVVVGGSLFGLRFIGWQGVVLVDLFFVALIAAAVLLIARPALFRKLAEYIPRALQPRLRTTVDAVCAYQGKGWLVTQAALLGIAVHAFNSLIYVMTAHALGVELGVGEVFFASTIQIFATLLPASINGIGLREATAVALYAAVGIPTEVAVLIPVLGFIVEMSISSIGGLVFVARRVGYSVDIEVEDPDREDIVNAEIPEVAPERWPRVGPAAALGLGAGLVAGLIIGAGEAVAVLAGAAGGTELDVLAYGATAYALLCGVGAAALGAGLAQLGRWTKREALDPPLAYARIAAFIVAAATFALGAFRVRRDVFHEQIAWKSPEGLLLLLGSMLAAGLVYLMLRLLLHALVARRPGRWLLRPWGSAAVTAGIAGALSLVPLASGSAPAAALAERPRAPALAGNVLFVVVDTLRADHLPMYGYEHGRTPHLDAFRKDAVLFEQAFANASWTRPSFASLLSGRYPASHRTMAKPDALPDEIDTLPEALLASGYYTAGVVTNYNVAPFFNFHQGFHDYRYLEPDFVLGASDTAAKLLLLQFLRQSIEKARAASGRVQRGSAYQDAEVVNREVARLLSGDTPEPWFVFAAYMDPHDPYYPHPYDGTGYARAAHQHPRPEEAPRLRALYDGEITYWDEHFGRLVAMLKERGLYDDLTLIVTSDHGEEFMDHGGYWHGTTLYDEQVRVPLLVKFPGDARGGTTIGHWVESIDIMPTVLEQADVEIPEAVQGKNLFVASHSVLAEENHEGNDLQSLRLREGSAEMKLITANDDNPRGLEPTELYRVDRDPHELDDLASERAEDVALVRAALAQEVAMAAEDSANKRTVNVATDAAALERLRALGYAADGEAEAEGAESR